MRILVTGNAGSGKTTLAKMISKKYGIPYSSLDGVVWQEGWQKTPRDVRKKEISRLVGKRSWVIDGVDYGVMDSAELIVFLDYPRRVCFYRALKRNVPYLFTSRPELPRNCPEIRILPQLVKIIWQFPKRVRPNIIAEEANIPGSFVHIHDNRELRAYLKNL